MTCHYGQLNDEEEAEPAPDIGGQKPEVDPPPDIGSSGSAELDEEEV